MKMHRAFHVWNLHLNDSTGTDFSRFLPLSEYILYSFLQIYLFLTSVVESDLYNSPYLLLFDFFYPQKLLSPPLSFEKSSAATPLCRLDITPLCAEQNTNRERDKMLLKREMHHTSNEISLARNGHCKGERQLSFFPGK